MFYVASLTNTSKRMSKKIIVKKHGILILLLLLLGFFKAVSLARDLGLWGGWGSFKGILTRIDANFRENSERLGRQARPDIEPGTSRLPILTAGTRSH